MWYNTCKLKRKVGRMAVVGSKKIDEAELEITLVRIESGVTPEDIFGMFPKVSGEELLNNVRKIYLRLQHFVHPDFYSRGDSVWERVNAASSHLNTKWDEAKKRIEQGIYGTNKTVEVEDNKPVVVQSRLYTYTLLKRVHVGDTCGIFEGTAQDKKGNLLHAVLKVPHSKDDNDLMDREAKNLSRIKENVNRLRTNPDGEKQAENALMVLPRLLESVRLRDGKVVNTFIKIPGYETGWFTLEEIRNRYPDGVSTRIMTFIWNRVFEGLILAHEARVVHGAISPHHIVIHAKKHLGNIIDWSSSCFTGEKPPYSDDKINRFRDTYLAAGQSPVQSSDVYSSALSMLYILGYLGEGGELKEVDIEPELFGFMNRCLQPNRRMRFPTTAEAYREFREVQKRVFGPRQFVELAMD